jgi:hypothetical protein
MRKKEISNSDMATNQMQKTQNTTHQFMLFLPSVRCHHDAIKPRERHEKVEVELKTFHKLFTT